MAEPKQPAICIRVFMIAIPSALNLPGSWLSAVVCVFDAAMDVPTHIKQYKIIAAKIEFDFVIVDSIKIEIHASKTPQGIIIFPPILSYNFPDTGDKNEYRRVAGSRIIPVIKVDALNPFSKTIGNTIFIENCSI